jgi:hypothetical protein
LTRSTRRHPFGFLAVKLATAAGTKDFVQAAKSSNALKVSVGATCFAFLLTLVAFARWARGFLPPYTG